MNRTILQSQETPKVKICGITNAGDALAAAEAGADYIGLVFAPSPRRITLRQALGMAAALSGLPDRPGLIGVFVDERLSTVLEIAAELKLWAVQLHNGGHGAAVGGLRHESRGSAEDCPPNGTDDGDPVAALRRLRQRTLHVIRTVRVRGDGIADTLPPADVPSDDPYVLLDAWSPGAAGGTGLQFDWSAVDGLRALWKGAKIILAGGLNPGNVRQAVRLTSPWAVDVSSGVESSPGKKDHELMKSFVRQVRRSQDDR